MALTFNNAEVKAITYGGKEVSYIQRRYCMGENSKACNSDDSD